MRNNRRGAKLKEEYKQDEIRRKNEILVSKIHRQAMRDPESAFIEPVFQKRSLNYTSRKAEQERMRKEASRKKRQDQRDLLEMAFGPAVYEGLLRRRKEDHGRFEDPYKTVCVCRLQGPVLRVRLTHNGGMVGLEEQFDLKREWRVMPHSNKAQNVKSSFHRVSLLYSRHNRALTL